MIQMQFQDGRFCPSLACHICGKPCGIKGIVGHSDTTTVATCSWDCFDKAERAYAALLDDPKTGYLSRMPMQAFLVYLCHNTGIITPADREKAERIADVYAGRATSHWELGTVVVTNVSQLKEACEDADERDELPQQPKKHSHCVNR